MQKSPPARTLRSRWALFLWTTQACSPAGAPKDDDLDVQISDPAGGSGGDGTTSSGTTDGGTTGSAPTDGPGLPPCRSADGHDTTVERMVESTSGILAMTVSYGGGCETHSFELCWPSGEFQEEEPVSATLELLHTGPPDSCEARVTEDLELDVTPMAEAWTHAYGSSSGELVLQIAGFSVLYRF